MLLFRSNRVASLQGSGLFLDLKFLCVFAGTSLFPQRRKNAKFEALSAKLVTHRPAYFYKTHMSNLLNLEEENKNAPTGETGHDMQELEGRMKSGANWFYWIAGLSAINSAIYAFGGDVAFLAGLGFTQVADALVDVGIESGLPAAVKTVAIVFNFAVVALFAFIGYYAGKGSSIGFIIGIVIYFFDALLVLLLGMMFGAAFHAFALIFIVRGFLACRTLNAHLAARMIQPSPPPPPPATSM
jgi:hypothetical protein